MGAWSFVEELIEETAAEMGFKNPRPRFAGRRSAASPATGSFQRHVNEQARLLEEALTIGLPRVGRIATRRAEDEAKVVAR